MKTQRHLIKGLTYLLFILFSLSTIGQKKAISFEVGLRYNLPERVFNKRLPMYDEQRSGLGISLMPKWNFTSNHSIGVDLGLDAIAEDARTDNIGSFTIISFMPTFKHKIFRTKFSPFYNVGLGVYSVLNSKSGASPGASLGVGFAIGSTLLSLDLNKLFSTVKINETIINGFDNWYFVGITLKFDME